MEKQFASSIIRQKMTEQGGHIRIPSINKKKDINGIKKETEYDVFLTADGKGFYSPNGMGTFTCGLEVFDMIYELLLREGGNISKCSGRTKVVGYDNCDEHTLRGIVAIEYFHKKKGESAGIDINHILAGVLEWAGIARNERGKITLM